MGLKLNFAKCDVTLQMRTPRD